MLADKEGNPALQAIEPDDLQHKKNTPKIKKRIVFDDYDTPF